jgi:hypothetical protein
MMRRLQPAALTRGLSLASLFDFAPRPARILHNGRAYTGVSSSPASNLSGAAGSIGLTMWKLDPASFERRLSSSWPQHGPPGAVGPFDHDLFTVILFVLAQAPGDPSLVMTD